MTTPISTPVTSPDTSPSTPTPKTPGPTTDPIPVGDHVLSTGAKIGAIVGPICTFASIIVAVLLYKKKKRHDRKMPAQQAQSGYAFMGQYDMAYR